jgi:hypothetical protein
MPQTKTHRSKSAAAVALVLLLAGLMLAACGGSSGKTTSSATASASASTTTTGTSTTGAPKGPGAGRFAALRECMAKNGITLPKRAPGQRPRPGAGGFLGGGAGPQLPKGLTRAQYEAVLKKCGGGAFRGGPRANSPAFRQGLVKFAACMRENGVKLPEPNNSGKGPIFDTKGVNTASTQFKAAERKCSSSLRGAFGGGAASGGAPPGSAGAPAAG